MAEFRALERSSDSRVVGERAIRAVWGREPVEREVTVGVTTVQGVAVLSDTIETGSVTVDGTVVVGAVVTGTMGGVTEVITTDRWDSEKEVSRRSESSRSQELVGCLQSPCKGEGGVGGGISGGG